MHRDDRWQGWSFPRFKIVAGYRGPVAAAAKARGKRVGVWIERGSRNRTLGISFFGYAVAFMVWQFRVMEV